MGAASTWGISQGSKSPEQAQSDRQIRRKGKMIFLIVTFVVTSDKRFFISFHFIIPHNHTPGKFKKRAAAAVSAA